MTPRLLSRDAAAAYCGVSPNAFDEHISGFVRPIEIGRRNLWDVRALDRWLDQQSGITHVARSILPGVARIYWLGAAHPTTRRFSTTSLRSRRYRSRR